MPRHPIQPVPDSAPTQPPTAHLIVAGDTAVLDPPLASVAAALTSSASEFVPGGPSGYRQIRRALEHFDFDYRGRLGFSAGLVPRVLELVAAAGLSVTVTDTCPLTPQQQPDPVAIAAMAQKSPALVQAVTANRYGQIEFADRDQQLGRILQIIALFPQARILIIAGTRADARRLWRLLIEQLGRRAVALPDRYRLPERGRLAVSHVCYREPWADVVILADMAGMMGSRAAKAMVSLDHSFEHFARIYGLRRRGTRLGAAGELRAEQMAGPIIFGEMTLTADLTTQICRSRSFPSRRLPPGLEGKRLGIWHHAARNQWIADVATATATGDLTTLCAHGLFLDVSDAQWLADLSPRRITVIVESTEHAAALHALLPDWPVRSCIPVAGKTKTDPKSHHSIVTWTYAASHILRADIVLRTDEGTEPLHLCGFPPPRCVTSRAMVIRFLDDTIPPTSRRRRTPAGQQPKKPLVNPTNRKNGPVPPVPQSSPVKTPRPAPPRDESTVKSRHMNEDVPIHDPIAGAAGPDAASSRLLHESEAPGDLCHVPAQTLVPSTAGGIRSWNLPIPDRRFPSTSIRTGIYRDPYPSTDTDLRAARAAEAICHTAPPVFRFWR